MCLCLPQANFQTPFSSFLATNDITRLSTFSFSHCPTLKYFSNLFVIFPTHRNKINPKILSAFSPHLSAGAENRFWVCGSFLRAILKTKFYLFKPMLRYFFLYFYKMLDFALFFSIPSLFHLIFVRFSENSAFFEPVCRTFKRILYLQTDFMGGGIIL